MNKKEQDDVRELGDITFLLLGQVVGLRTKHGEKLKDIMKEMQPFKDRIEELLIGLGL